MTIARSYLKQHFPGLWNRLRSVQRSLRDAPTGRLFKAIYESNAWGAEESRSGPGSTLDGTAQLRRRLPELLREIGTRTLLDAPCGDYRWMREVELPGLSYIGADVVPGLIADNQARYGAPAKRFLVLDIIKDPLPAADVILCRDCLVHFSDRRIRAAVKNFRRSGATYLLTTTFPDHGASQSIISGQWQPLNLERPPFNFPAPLRTIHEGLEGEYRDKTLALWRIADL